MTLPIYSTFYLNTGVAQNHEQRLCWNGALLKKSEHYYQYFLLFILALLYSMQYNSRMPAYTVQYAYNSTLQAYTVQYAYNSIMQPHAVQWRRQTRYKFLEKTSEDLYRPTDIIHLYRSLCTACEVNVIRTKSSSRWQSCIKPLRYQTLPQHLCT